MVSKRVNWINMSFVKEEDYSVEVGETGLSERAGSASGNGPVLQNPVFYIIPAVDQHSYSFLGYASYYIDQWLRFKLFIVHGEIVKVCA